MIHIFSALYIFLQIVYVLVIVDILFSWGTLLLPNIRRPRFLSDLFTPLYGWIGSVVPTRFGMFDLTPLVLIFAISVVQVVILILAPGDIIQLQRLLPF